MQQLVANGVLAAAIYVMVATGFALIYATSRFLHFAHAVVFTAGAYFALFLATRIGLPLAFSVLLALVLSAVLGCLAELVVYRPLRRRGSSPLVLLLSALGIYIVLQNGISMLFGDDLKIIPGLDSGPSFTIGLARVTPVQIVTIATGALCVVATAIVLKTTRVGKMMRAVASDSELAEISGVRAGSVILASFAVGSVLAGLAGVLVALDTAMTPDMGLNVFLMAAAAMILGGVESIPGIALGALLVGLTQHFGVWLLGSQWQDAIAFTILLIALAVRPQGLLGKRAVRATA